MAVLGGTFDQLHAGHRRLLETAFQTADIVGIGLTTLRYLRAHPKPMSERIRPYAARRRGLVRYLRANWPERRWWVAPLNDGWGKSVDPGVDVLVASEETRPGALAVNRERRRRGLAPLRLKLIPLLSADDGRPIASRRIRAGEIDPEGHSGRTRRAR